MILFLASWGALIGTVLLLAKISDRIRNRVLVELDISDPLVKRDSRAFSLTLLIENTGNRPATISSPLLTIFEGDNRWTEIRPANAASHDSPHSTTLISPIWDAEYVHPGQLLEKRLHFTLPRHCKDGTFCCHVTTQLDKTRKASTSLLGLNLHKESARKLSAPVY
jgi:hypothetical protein